MIILVLCTEVFYSDIQEPKLEAIFGVINKLMKCPEFKKDFFIDFSVAAASENASMMENGCLLGQLISLSLVVKDNLSDVKRVQSKIFEKIKVCKSQGAYEKTLKVVFL